MQPLPISMLDLFTKTVSPNRVLLFLKTKTKLVFTLDKECDVIKDILSGDDNNNRLVNYYLLINKSFIRFKKNKQNFIIEIENNLY